MPAQEPSRPSDRVTAMFNAAIKGDLAGIGRQVHPDVEVVEPASLPFGGVYRGRDAFLGDLFAKMTADFDLGLDDVRVIDGGDVVVGQMITVFTARRSGKALRVPYVEIYELEDGLIRTITVYPSDTKAIIDFMEDNS